MIKILHFIGDKKFAGWIIPVFDLTNDEAESQFIFVGAKNYELKNIKDVTRVKIIEASDVMDYVSHQNPDAIMIHGLDSYPLTQIKDIPDGIKVFWFAWGYDLYSPVAYKPFINIPLYERLTKKAMWQGFVYKLREIHGALHQYKLDRIIKEGVRRVDYFSGVYAVEGEFMQKLPFFSAELVTFRYITINGNGDMNEEKLNAPKASCGGIVVGNSADPTNNHIDIYAKLFDMGVTNVNIYSFLSYGGSPSYRQKVIEKGKRYFGDFFHPIVDFLPYEEYSKIMNSCNVIIMGHKRQQAAGNISAGFWNGCYVFVPSDSIACKQLSRENYHFYKFPEDFSKDILNTPLHDEYVQQNRKLCLKYSKLEVGLNLIRGLYKIIRDKNNENG